MTTEHKERGILPEVREADIALDEKRHSVLSGLVSSNGDMIGQFLVAKALSGRNQFHFEGPPASGKSTIISQYIDALEINASRLGIPFDYKVVRYEEVLAKAERKLGSREEWDNNKWVKDFNLGMLVPAILEAHANASDTNPHAAIIENPGIGSNRIRDVGKTAASTLAKSQGELPPSERDAYFIYLVSDPSLKKRATMLRNRIVNIPPGKVISTLRDDFNIEVADMPDTASSGRTIQRIYRRMAQQQHINRISLEIHMELARWQAEHPTLSRELQSQIQIPNNFGHGIDNIFMNAGEVVSQSLDLGKDSYREQAGLEAAHVRHVMDEELRIGENGIVAFNSRVDDPIFVRLKV